MASSLTPSAMRKKLTNYNSFELTAFFRGIGDKRAVKRLIRYAERAIGEIEAAEADKEKMELEAQKTALQKQIEKLDKKIGAL